MAEVSTFPTAATLTGAEFAALVQGAGGVKITTLELLRQTAALAEAFTFGGLVTLAGGVAVGNAAADPFTINSSAVSAPNGLAFSGAAVSFAQAVALNGGVTLGDAAADALTINSTTATIPAAGLRFNGGNLGVGVVPASTWSTNYRVIDVGGSAFWASVAGDAAFMSANTVYDGAAFKAKAAGGAGHLAVTSAGELVFNYAASVLTGATQTMVEAFRSSGASFQLGRAGTARLMCKAADASTRAFDFVASNDIDVMYAGVGGMTGGENGAAAAVYVTKNGTTNRSINAAGTLNANGSDMAEYLRKGNWCSNIAKGQICGIDANRQLTTHFDLMVRPAVKSTDPSYVGGDRWGAAALVGARPVEPALERPHLELPPAPEPVYGGREPPAAGEPLYELKLAAYEADRRAFELEVREVAALYAEAVRAAREEHAAEVALAERRHGLALEAHKLELAAFEEKLEAARVQYDRITWAGQVPAIVAGEVVAGAYVIAEDDGAGGICGRCYLEPTLAQLRHKVGFVMVANPTEAQFRELIDASIPLEPGWNAILDVGR